MIWEYTKAIAPINVMLSFKIIFIKFLHPKKQEFPIYVIVVGRIIDSNSKHPENMYLSDI